MKPYGGYAIKTACEARGRKRNCYSCRLDRLNQKWHRNDRALQKREDYFELKIAADELNIVEVTNYEQNLVARQEFREEI